MTPVVAKAEICGSCTLTLAGIGAFLHGAYFVLAFISVATGAFLGVVGVWNWLKGRR